MDQPVRVLLCGTVFGQVYLRGVLKTGGYVLKGILSKGSPQSRAVAAEYGLRLHTDPAEISAGEYDLALVVVRSGIVGGSGSEIAATLLQKGVSVVQEQPVHAEEAIENYRLARENGAAYLINTFYPYLPASRAFHQEIARVKTAGESVLRIGGSCSMPTLLPFLDQVCRAAGGVTPFAVDREHVIRQGVVTAVPLTVSRVPCLLEISGSLNREDIDRNAYILNELRVSSMSQNLVMTEVNGQVVRIAKPYIAEEYLRETVHDPVRDCSGTDVLYDASGRTFGTLYGEEWPQAVSAFLTENEEMIRSKRCPAAHMQYYAALCDLWKEISGLLSR